MIPAKVLAVRYLANAAAPICRGLQAPEGYPALAMLTADSDDPTYIALDQATKAADVKVCFARSFYAGAANASTPLAGEILGVLAGRDPGAVRSCGSFLAAEAGVKEGQALAYLIAPPLESMYGLDHALKAADVKLCKLYEPPTQTNFGGGLLTGSQSACYAACAAFKAAVAEVAAKPKG